MISLIIPPGWTLHAGGPHIAVPLLCRYLERHGIQATPFDLNIGAAKYHDALISEADALAACSSRSVNAMNDLYFNVEDRLSAVGAAHGGTWFAHEGYKRSSCDLGDPESVRELSCSESPFTTYFKEVAIPAIMNTSPRIIGLSLYVPSQLLPAFELVRLLRSAGYNGFIALGGNMITRIAEDMKLPWVFELIDGVVIYQGERALKDIHDALENRRSLDGVPNLIWRTPDGRIVQNSTVLLKPQEFEGATFDDIVKEPYWGARYLPMVGARGCFYGKCSFCAIPYGWGPNNYIGMPGVAKIIGMMNDAFQKTGVSRFKFIDEAIHPKMIREMANSKSAFSEDYTFEGYVRFDSNWADPDFLDACRTVGMRKAFLGLELAPSQTRDVLNKSDRADPVTVLRRMKDADIKTHIFCMFGYPGTGVDEAIKTVEFALEHADLIDTLDIFPFYYARHSKVDGVRIVDAPQRTWTTEHAYVPDGDNVLWPEEVEMLAERTNEIVWKQHPHWAHPVYRMVTPWHT